MTVHITPPTPDPRERGEFNADDAALLVRYRAAPRCESHVGVPFTKVKREHCVNCLAIAIKAALRAPAPSEAVAWERQEAEWFRWLRDNPQSAAFIAVLVAKNRPHGPDLGASMNSGEVIGVMEDAKQPDYRYTHPAPARGVTVTEAMVERAMGVECGSTHHEHHPPDCRRCWQAKLTAALTPDAEAGA